MSAIAAPNPPAPYATSGFFRLTVDEYHEMIRNGILTTDDRVELLDGYLVNKMPQNAPHAGTTQRLTKLLLRLVPAGWVVRVQLPVTLTMSEPEPDGAIVRGSDTTYDARHPGAADFGVLIEVADSSLAMDRREKGSLYAQAGIPVYWVINLVDRQIEVYTDPDAALNPPVYATRTDFSLTKAVPLSLDGKVVAVIPVADLIP